MSGYLDRRYAASLRHVGYPIVLPGSGGYLMRRAIGKTGQWDATGSYPFLTCRDWGGLAGDLDQLEGFVSVVAVPDPLGNFGPDDLRRAFPDHVVPYKTHYLVDLTTSELLLPAGHLRNLRATRGVVEVEQVQDPRTMLGEWVALYANLAARHRIAGPADFPREAFAQQLAVPGLMLLRALVDGDTAGMALFYAVGEDVYYHLGAYSPVGYDAGASFALFDHAIRLFRAEGRHRLLLGSGAGDADSGGRDGLSRFKRGWATGTIQGWLCGRIFNSRVYAELSGGAGDYFPAYRAAGGDHARAACDG